MNRRLRVSALLCSLAVGACGGGDPENSAPPPTPAPLAWLMLSSSCSPQASTKPLVGAGSTAACRLSLANVGTASSGPSILVLSSAPELRIGAVRCMGVNSELCPSAVGRTIQIGSMPAATQLDFTIDLTPAPRINGSLQAHAHLSSDHPAELGTADVDMVVDVYSADLQLQLNQPPISLQASQQAVLEAEVSNLGPGQVARGFISLDHSSGVSLIGHQCSLPDGLACPTATVNGVSRPLILPGTAQTWRYTVAVQAGLTGTARLTVSLNTEGDPDRSNNQITLTLPVLP